MSNTTLSSGVELCRRDSGDCMCMWAESEPAACFFLGILNGDAMLKTQKETKQAQTKPLTKNTHN